MGDALAKYFAKQMVKGAAILTVVILVLVALAAFGGYYLFQLTHIM